MNAASHDPIAIALAEDIAAGDRTSEVFIPESLQAIGRIVARQPAILAGVGTAAEVFRQVDASLAIMESRRDGDSLRTGDEVLSVRGSARSILTSERVALNFLQRLSGIATLTRRFVDAIAGTRARILDTRKTTPGLRALEKAAVVAGGGQNHRANLSDMILVKDNHLAAIERRELAQRVRELRTKFPKLRVELEADTLEQVREFLQLEGIDIILLDNMKPEQLREAVGMRGNSPVQFEASGGITLENVRAVAETGVDFISVGALTHSAPAVDFSLELTHA